MFLNICVAKSQNRHVVQSQLFTAPTVCFLRSNIVVPTTVQFNGQLCCGTVEIHNKAINRLLPLKTNRIIPQEFIPQFPFPWCHIFAKIPGVFYIIWIVILHHCASVPARPQAASAPSARGLSAKLTGGADPKHSQRHSLKSGKFPLSLHSLPQSRLRRASSLAEGAFLALRLSNSRRFEGPWRF